MTQSTPLPMIPHYINHEKITDHQALQSVFNPALGQAIRSVPMASQAIIDHAIVSAQTAFTTWSLESPLKRARIFFEYKQLLQKHADAIATSIVEEHGKTWEDAHGEIARGIEIVEYACGAQELLKGEHNSNIATQFDSWSEFAPLGVVVGITPFNFPAMVPMWMFPIAIVCGNTFILKPSEKDPSTAILLAELLTQAGLPKGVFNVIHGDKQVVNSLLTDARIQAVSFVGSTHAAHSIYQTASHYGKRVQALGGAKNHAVIMPDADIENTANALMGAAYGSCGERCMAISVAVIVDKPNGTIAEQLISALQNKISHLKIGPGLERGLDMGALISADHKQAVSNYIQQGQDEGASLLVDGRTHDAARAQGFFLGASLFDHVKANMRIYQEEIFGPVLCIVRVSSLNEAIELINQHPYGNGTCLFTQNGAIAKLFSQHVQIGMVGINVALPVPIASQSFGGWKRSLFGDLHAYGPDGIRFYTRRKTISQRWQLPEHAEFYFPSNGQS